MEKSASSPLTKQILTAVYIIHLIIIAVYTTFILFKYGPLITPSITFAMLIIYGYMGIWVLMVSFIFIVYLNIFRFLKNMRPQPY